jgi:hypothetical protein
MRRTVDVTRVLRRLIREELSAEMSRVDMDTTSVRSYVDDVDSMGDSLSRMLDMYEDGGATYAEVSDVIVSLYDAGLTYTDVVELDPRVSSVSSDMRVFEARDSAGGEYSPEHMLGAKKYPSASRKLGFRHTQRRTELRKQLPQLRRMFKNLLDRYDQLVAKYIAIPMHSRHRDRAGEHIEDIYYKVKKVEDRLHDAGLTDEEIYKLAGGAERLLAVSPPLL